MNTEEYIKLIFTNMVCSCCDTQFTPDCIEIIRVEDNIAVVKIVCQNCHKNYGIAIIGIEESAQNDTFEDYVQIPDLPPITTDDVIEAHNFINKLGNDWSKYIPDELKTIDKLPEDN